MYEIYFGFNPCFSGRYSAILQKEVITNGKNSFNPCFSGRYSAILQQVLLLINMTSFNPCFSGRYSAIPIMYIYIHYRSEFQSLFQWKVLCNLVELAWYVLIGPVSILVLVEGTLQFGGVESICKIFKTFQSLFQWKVLCNPRTPIFVQSWRERFQSLFQWKVLCNSDNVYIYTLPIRVSILVLVEGTLQ